MATRRCTNRAAAVWMAKQAGVTLGDLWTYEGPVPVLEHVGGVVASYVAPELAKSRRNQQMLML